MAIIRITKKQIEAANKAREAALSEDYGFRLHDDRLKRLLRDGTAALDRSPVCKKQHPAVAVETSLPAPARDSEPT